MNGGTCLHETPSKRLPSGRKKNVRCNRSSLLTNSLPYKEGQGEGGTFVPCSHPYARQALVGLAPFAICGLG
jgi:hypothetical protein